MGNIKSFTGKEIIKKLQKIGFDVIRIKGSHYFMRHRDSRITVVPIHKNETVGIGLFKKILKDIDLSSQEFMDI